MKLLSPKPLSTGRQSRSAISFISMCLAILPTLEYFQFSSVQLLSRVRLFATPWITARQASLSITKSWSPPKPMSIESVMPSSHLILCRPLLLLPQSLPASGSFPMSQLFAWGGQSIGVSALASVLPMNTQDWFPLGWTGWISFILIRKKSEITYYIVFDSIYWKTHTYCIIYNYKGI